MSPLFCICMEWVDLVITLHIYIWELLGILIEFFCHSKSFSIHNSPVILLFDAM
jgi:hypothetical protein